MCFYSEFLKMNSMGEKNEVTKSSRDLYENTGEWIFLQHINDQRSHVSIP